MEPVPAPRSTRGEYAARFGTDGGEGLCNLDYAPVAEQTGRSALAPLVINCNAPDTGNMEVLLKYGTDEQRATWLEPLLDARIRSAFTMTEPDVASSDATNMAATAVVQGDEVVVNGRKWWSTGAGHPDCRIFVFMGLTDPDADRHARHSMVLVPADTAGVRVERRLTAMGMYDEPLGHAEISFTDVRVPARQRAARPRPRLRDRPGPAGARPRAPLHAAGGPGRARPRAGLPAGDRSGWRSAGRWPSSAATPNGSPTPGSPSTRLGCWCCTPPGSSTRPAPRGAVSEVSQIKVAVPAMAQRVIDMAIQLHGAAGVSDDFPLAAAWTTARTLRLADGPDEVHRGVIAKLELGKYT